jgi:hypothetical protein
MPPTFTVTWTNWVCCHDGARSGNRSALPSAFKDHRIVFSRYDRDNLIEVINRYLNEELTSFKLDEALTEIGTKTKDKTVEQVVQLLWHHYDDVEDHKVVASKEEWGYFQRLLLILKSDAEIVQETGERKWTARQAVAAVCLALFGLTVVKTGFGCHLLVVTMPLGIVSMLLSHWRSHDEARRLHDQTAVLPFGSVSELIFLRRKVRNFVKARYPARLGSRQIRGTVSAAAMWLRFGAVWLIFSPVPLVFQMLPEPEHRWKVAGP